MKKKTINAVIGNKFDEWLKSITDDAVRKLVETNTIVTGGCIASMLLKEEVNDFDCYFTNKETTKAVAEYYVKQWNETNSDDGYVLDGAVQHENNPDSKGGVALNMTPDRIKIIFESSGVAKEAGALEDATEIEEWPDGKAVVDEESKPKYRPIYISCPLLAKELRYVGSKYPLASVIRTRKFIKRGWTINAGQYLKMAFQISALDLTNIAVLEDQLTGVDVAYFNVLINALQKKQESEKEDGKEFKLEYSYLATIIDKIF